MSGGGSALAVLGGFSPINSAPPSRVRGSASEANTAAFYGDDCARQIGLAMTRENLLHQRDPGWRGHVRKANDSGMRRARKVDDDSRASRTS